MSDTPHRRNQRLWHYGDVWRSSDGRIYLRHCPKCNRENWGPCVARGVCAWCGHIATAEDLPSEDTV